jgi:hypothetical protein
VPAVGSIYLRRELRAQRLSLSQFFAIEVSLQYVRSERPRHSLLSPPESARDLIQALGRNRRVGQRSPAFRTILTLAGSVEERVKAAVERKAAQNETINDGDLRCSA